MAFDGLLVTEIFHSLQGETSLSGVPFSFIRLTGCNLRCVYCDSAYTFKGGTRMSIAEVLDVIKPHQTKHVLLTGGEPLLQRNTSTLVDELCKLGYWVSIETHGEVSIARVAKKARIILDIKTPGSGMYRGGYRENLPLLKSGDEVKFVLISKEDYDFARSVIEGSEIPSCAEILLSPAVPALGSPGTFSGVDLRWLAEKILADKLKARLQIQLHKLIWGPDRKGV